MCGRYTFTTPAPSIEQRFDATFVDAPPITFNAAPSQHLPVVLNVAPHEIRLVQWGLIPAWTKELHHSPKPINARAETLLEKPTFRQLVQRHRCLVLADSFYEWTQTPQGKVPHRILRQDEQPFAFAGLWDEWADRSTGEVIPSFTIVTTEPNELMSRLHNRMPVILPDKVAEEAWLSKNISAAEHQALLRPLPDGVLKEYAVTTRVNSPAHNDASLLEPAA